MFSRRKSQLGLVVPVALLLATACGTHHESGPAPQPRATLAAFRGSYGHDRGLAIEPGGHGREVVNSGCCRTVIDLSFKLSRPTGTVTDATVTYRVTAVRRYRRSWARRPRPRVGQQGRLRRRNGVITDSITGATFCVGVPRCGA
jgi:hypothetical protein